MNYVLIVGAKSDIGKALAENLAKKGYCLYLAGRKIEELKVFSKNLEIRHDISVQNLTLNIEDFVSHEGFYNTLEIKPIGVISVVGYLGNQELAEINTKEFLKITQSNYTGIANFLNIIAKDFSINQKGFIVGITSVAGDLGKESNYIYGASKAAFSAYLSGLRQKLYKKNVHVLTVKPGFVRTKMTKDMKLPEHLTISPKKAANDIVKAIEAKKNVLYTLWIWKYIMIILGLIPNRIFKKLKL